MLHWVLCALPLLLLRFDTAFSAKPPVVSSSKIGTITGSTKRILGIEAEQFLGIPYALPPKGEYRFAKPRPVGPLGQVNATALGNKCPQANLLPLPQSPANMDEDCLNLNVHRKVGTTKGSKRPVVVLIHGGGFSAGSSGDPIYNGAPLAALNNLVTVSMNYRLGILGFGDMGEFAPGNLGLWDQQLALQWVRDNIEDFGGDPNRVVLMGASAGSMSISSHLVSPVIISQKLFHGAIMDGGAFVPTFYANPKETFDRIREIGNHFGCGKSGSQLLTCLRAIPAQQLINASIDVERFGPALTFYPSMDGKYVPFTVMSQKKASNQVAPVSLIIGYSKDEGSLFTNYYLNPARPLEKLNTKERLVNYLAKLSRAYKFDLKLDSAKVREAVLKTFDLAPSETLQVYAHMAKFMTAGSFICPMNAFLKDFAKHNQNAYMHVNMRALAGKYYGLDSTLFGAFHLTQFFYMTGTLLSDKALEIHPLDLKYMQHGMQMVADFADNPNQAPLYTKTFYQKFDPKTEPVLRLKEDGITIENGLLLRNECKAVFSHYELPRRQRLALLSLPREEL